MKRAERIWVRLGGLSLNLLAYLFYATRQGPKIIAVARHYSIARGQRFLGELLTEPYTLHPGWIVERRHGGNGTAVWYHFKSLYDFTRSFEHAQVSAKQARKDVEVSIAVAIEIVQNLLAFWPLEKAVRRQLARKLRELRDRHEHARRPALRQATDRVQASAGFRDRLGRGNPSAAGARLTASVRDYHLRLGELTAIVPNLNRLYAMMVQEQVRIQTLMLERVAGAIKEVMDASPRCTTLSHCQWAREKIRYARDELQSVMFAPFSSDARAIEGDLVNALRVLHDEEQPIAKRFLDAMGYLDLVLRRLACKKVQRDLEVVIRSLSSALRDSQMRNGRVERFVRRIEAAVEALDALSDEEFEHPCLVPTKQALRPAIVRLRDGAFEDAKEQLKRASALL